ncbi:hypothetical protein Tco_0448822 [Tanacetum coccineum]
MKIQDQALETPSEYSRPRLDTSGTPSQSRRQRLDQPSSLKTQRKPSLMTASEKWRRRNLHDRVKHLRFELNELRKAIDIDPSSATLREEEALYLHTFNEAILDVARNLIDFISDVNGNCFEGGNVHEGEWDIIGTDISNVVREFLVGGKLLKEVNHTIIALILKESISKILYLSDLHKSQQLLEDPLM